MTLLMHNLKMERWLKKCNELKGIEQKHRYLRLKSGDQELQQQKREIGKLVIVVTLWFIMSFSSQKTLEKTFHEKNYLFKKKKSYLFKKNSITFCCIGHSSYKISVTLLMHILTMDRWLKKMWRPKTNWVRDMN